jgi:hypothetical protein
VDSGESLYAGLLTEKKSGKTQQKQDITGFLSDHLERKIQE